MKKLLKLLAAVQTARHGHAGYAYKPWKGKKWKGQKYGAYGPHGYPPHGSPYGHGPAYPPHGYARPRGLKGMLLEAVLNRLLRKR